MKNWEGFHERMKVLGLRFRLGRVRVSTSTGKIHNESARTTARIREYANDEHRDQEPKMRRQINLHAIMLCFFTASSLWSLHFNLKGYEYHRHIENGYHNTAEPENRINLSPSGCLLSCCGASKASHFTLS